MEATFRVSVRELVGFSYFPPDILPASMAAEMLAGTQAHQAREGAQAGEFEIEKPIRGNVEASGECVTVFGRMDAYRDGEPPVVEEIKLSRNPPESALPEHLAQARLYAALLTMERPLAAVEVRVVYVNAEGEPLRVFAERAEPAFLQRTLQDMLLPWLAFAVPERERVARRNESLRALPFPFEAYRAGQRELAVQVYTAIIRKKRLFATLPTGTGKSAAVLYPALKALGEGKTRLILYLTARTTARQSPLNALERMRAQGARIRVVTVLAKEKLCPAPTRCHPEDCPRAKGHFLRQPDAVQKLFRMDVIWTDEVITAVAQEFMLCPFELALTLTEYADVALLDMNYAFDPFAQIVRVFKRRKDFTLLTDEAHHLLDRVRDSLSGSLDTRELRISRTLFGKALGRKHPYYKLLSGLLAALTATQPTGGEPPPVETDVPEAAGNGRVTQPKADTMPGNQPPETARFEDAETPARETRLDTLPENVTLAAQALCEATLTLLCMRLPTAELRQEASRLIRRLAPFLYAAEHFGERYAALLECRGRERILEAYCLSPAEHIAQITQGVRGAVFFSATLSPLTAMRSLQGGTEEDACFAHPSPFDPQRLAVVRKRIQTRYACRVESAPGVAAGIAEAVRTRAGKYIAYFPSYAYLRLVLAQLETYELPPLLVQESDMTDEARARFLAAFTQDAGPRLGLCVLGGLFSEGVDLPGDQLIGAIIVGVGLPTPSLRLRTLQRYYDGRFGDGFLYAWMIPAMQKVSQAGGRVIRTEEDKGLILLMDDRYYETRYARLLPPAWRLTDEDIVGAAAAVYRLEDI